jgi:hypothetical protein
MIKSPRCGRSYLSTAVAFVTICIIAPLMCAVATAAYAGEPESCPNAALRVEDSSALAHCRAYERVSPPRAEPEFLFEGASETGVQVEGKGTAKEVQASTSGERFAYVTTYPPEGSPSDGQYLRVTRGPDGWTSEEMIPPQSTHYFIACRSGYIAAYSPDLTSEVLADGVGQPGSSLAAGVLECGTDDPPLVAGEPQGFQNLFLAESEPGPYRLVDEIGQAPGGSLPVGAWFEAASEDLSHIVFVEAARLTPEAPPVEQAAEINKSQESGPLPDLYEWTEGGLRLVTVLPSGTPTAGSLANGYLPEEEGGAAAETFTHAVSANGSRVAFRASGNLYLRLNAEQPQSALDGEEHCLEPVAACTVQVDAGQGGPESGGGRFMWATPEGTRVFFLDEKRLTSDSTAASGAPDLYEYDVAAPVGERLHDLTTHAGEPADVLGVSGISDDGSYVYFVANGSLAENENSAKATAIAGQPNLYLAHEGAITFVATLGSSDEPDWTARKLTARVTPNGKFLVFNSERELTKYDNIDVATGEHDWEIFQFGAQSDSLACVSCSPTESPSTAYAKIPVATMPIFGGGSPLKAAGYLQHNLTDDGRVFFSTAEKLLPEATNGVSNVYEYDAGTLHLISTGTSADPSYFYDASADGSDVFFITSQELPSGEPANEFRVYDAREDGGFPVPPPPPEPCAGEGCRSPVAPSTGFSAPPTAQSLPSGNVPPPSNEAKTPLPPKSAAQIRREALAHALARCRKLRRKHKRVACEAQARRRYGTKTAARRGKR